MTMLNALLAHAITLTQRISPMACNTIVIGVLLSCVFYLSDTTLATEVKTPLSVSPLRVTIKGQNSHTKSSKHISLRATAIPN